jgi:transposase-like protein
MNKEEIRKEFFKLRMKGHSYKESRKLLKILFQSEFSVRTLKRWEKKSKTTEWNLEDKSTRPKIIHYKITPLEEKKIIDLRNKTGFGEDKLANYFKLGHTSINKILRRNKLVTYNEKRKKRLKYIRWQRKHTNSLWQMDLSDQKIQGKYCFAVIDDCSRYCIGLFALNQYSTLAITHILDKLIKIHGAPREILTDNGNVFGLRSKHSRFDIWCRRRGIKHIRTAVHSPTTSGKIERFFQTLDKEFEICKKDSEFFRMRYNHFRPHTSLFEKSPAEVYFAFEKLL